ncbi:alpha/beta hydrolase [Streptomyces sp. NPDC093707]|uniref:alpha/beta hydrolase n=1 Tax=Streptomyces sp. NPDC093707 TaxID=3154984 RepID=UPI00344BC159
MVNFSQLRAIKPSGFEEAAGGWHKVSSAAGEAKERVDYEIVATLQHQLEGKGPDAALARLRRLSRNFQYTQVESGLIRTALTGLASELRAAQKKLNDAVMDAEAEKFTVKPDGTVHWVSPQEKVPFTPEHTTWADGPGSTITTDPQQAKAQGYADRIGSAIQDANEADARYSRTLDRLKADNNLDVTTSDWTDAQQDMRSLQKSADKYLRHDGIPKDKSPTENATWWKGLSPERQQELIALYPDQVGKLDGIPATVRDEANRAYLPMLISKLDNLDDEKARTQLEGLREISRKLDEGSHPPMFLLGIDDKGNGRAILSYGNPDTSKNVSAYVPGLGTALDKDFATIVLKRAQDTAIGAQRLDPSSASIVWLGYDAPQLPTDSLLGNLDILGEQNARAGAPAYASFMSGLNVSNDNPDPHITAIGHSYGSLTVGQTALMTKGIPGVDDIVLVGSPGTGAQSAADLGVGKGHVFVGAAENDPVTQLPSKAEGGGMLGGAWTGSMTGEPVIAGLGGAIGYGVGSLMSDDNELWFGTDPASEEFGARRFKVDAGPRPFVDGQGPTPAHSNYFDPGVDPTSAANISAVVANRPDLVTPEAGR